MSAPDVTALAASPPTARYDVEKAIIEMMRREHLFRSVFASRGYKCLLAMRCWSAKIEVQVREQCAHYWKERTELLVREQPQHDGSGGSGPRSQHEVYARLSRLIDEKSVLAEDCRQCAFSRYRMLCGAHALHRHAADPRASAFTHKKRYAVHDLQNIAFYAFTGTDARSVITLRNVCDGGAVFTVHLRVFDRVAEYIDAPLHADTSSLVPSVGDATGDAERTAELVAATVASGKCYYDRVADRLALFDFDADAHPQRSAILAAGNKCDFKASLTLLVQLTQHNILSNTLGRFDYNAIATQSRVLIVDRANAAASCTQFTWPVPTCADVRQALELVSCVVATARAESGAEAVSRADVLQYCAQRGWIDEATGAFVDGAVDGCDYGLEKAECVLDDNAEWERGVKLCIARAAATYPPGPRHCFVVEACGRKRCAPEPAAVFGVCENVAAVRAARDATRMTAHPRFGPAGAHVMLAINVAAPAYRDALLYESLLCDMEAACATWLNDVERVRDAARSLDADCGGELATDMALRCDSARAAVREFFDGAAHAVRRHADERALRAHAPRDNNDSESASRDH